MPDLARDRQRDVKQQWQLGQDDPLGLLEKQVEKVCALSGVNRRLAAQQQYLPEKLVGVVGAGSAVCQGEPLHNGFGSAIGGPAGRIHVVVRHLGRSE